MLLFFFSLNIFGISVCFQVNRIRKIYVIISVIIDLNRRQNALQGLENYRQKETTNMNLTEYGLC